MSGEHDFDGEIRAVFTGDPLKCSACGAEYCGVGGSLYRGSDLVATDQIRWMAEHAPNCPHRAPIEARRTATEPGS